MPSYEDSEMPAPISKQLLEIREKPKSPQLNAAARAMGTALGEAMRAVRDLRSGDGDGLERSSSGYGQVDDEKSENVKEPVSRSRNDARGRTKDVFEVLQKKETNLCRVRQEVESLRLVIPLLVEDMEETEPTSPSSTTQDADAVTRKAAQLVPAAQDSTAGRRNGWLPGKLLDLS
jgi:hypothetical protein